MAFDIKFLGEALGAEEFSSKLTEIFGWQCAVPIQDELVSLK